MSFKNINLHGIECRVMRISFTGELCYEINAPSGYAKQLWDICIDKGQNLILLLMVQKLCTCYVLKSFIIVGQETDGSVTPVDLDMDWIISKKKYDFIGKRALNRSDTIKKDENN